MQPARRWLSRLLVEVLSNHGTRSNCDFSFAVCSVMCNKIVISLFCTKKLLNIRGPLEGQPERFPWDSSKTLMACEYLTFQINVPRAWALLLEVLCEADVGPVERGRRRRTLVEISFVPLGRRWWVLPLDRVDPSWWETSVSLRVHLMWM